MQVVASSYQKRLYEISAGGFRLIVYRASTPMKWLWWAESLAKGGIESPLVRDSDGGVFKADRLLPQKR